MSPSATITPNKSQYLRYARAISALMIFFCHVFSYNSPLASLLSQFLNVGVPIFFMMSGYLLSHSKKQLSYPSWIKKRCSRLLTPYWICLILYIPAAYFIAKKFDLKSLLWNVFPISGLTENYLYEAGGHLWFITHIAICYLLFPLIKLFKKPSQNNPTPFALYFLFLYVIILLGINHLVPGIFCTLVASLVSFTLGFLYLDHFLDKAKLFLPLLPISIALRFVLKYFFDDTPIYTYFGALVSHQLLAVSLIALLYLIYEYGHSHFRLPSAIKSPLLFIEKISYEFYITHQFFLIGALDITLFQSRIANVFIAFFLSITSAFLIHKLNKQLNNVFTCHKSTTF